MPSYDATSVRLQLLANGYNPTPNLDKRCVLKGWASPAFVESLLLPETVPAWAKTHRNFRATGILVRDGLMPIDCDVSDEVMTQHLQDAMADIMPGAFEEAPWRTGKYPKLMVFTRWQASARYPDMFVRIASDKFTSPDGAHHQIEVFGGAPSSSGGTSKQVGAFGPHSYEEIDGKINFRKIKHSYDWGEDDAPTPLTVPLAELPAVTQDQVWDLLAAFERLALEAGWVRQEAPPKTAAGRFVYDITPDTVFEPEHAEECSYYDLDEGMRVSGSFIDGSAKRRDKCSVLHCKAKGVLGVFDHENDAWHLPAEAAPPSTEQQNTAFQEALTKLQTAPRASITQQLAPVRPKPEASLAEKAHWLLQSYAYCPPNHSVVELFEAGDACEMRPQAFQTKYLAWREESEGPRGGRHVALATAAWLIHDSRPTIRGVRMRPDMDYPLYEEMGHFYKNTYLRPIHAGDGEVSTFLDFVAHLLPIAEERDWFLNWVAHKYRYPDIPGVAVVMVAAGPDGPVYGAGRGMLRDVLARLMGPRYVRAIDFDVFSGRSAQGVYTDWAAYATLVTVSESKDTPESGRWTAQRAVYERIKEIVDPRAVERTFMRKGLPAFVARSYASYLIFSNNRDALQIPADDRRVTALRNGQKLPPNKAAVLQAWMEMPGNINALATFLEARDLSQFDAYTPLRTATKDTMQELARSELDDAYDAVRRRIGPSRLFTGEQIRAAVLADIGDVMGSEILRNQINRKLRSDASQVSDYRLPPTSGRHKIMAWRDVGGRSVAGNLDIEQARSSVQKTAEVLFTTESVVITFPVAPDGGSTKK